MKLTTSGAVMEKDDLRAIEALNTIIGVLAELDDQSRMRVIKSVLTFFHLPQNQFVVEEVTQNTAEVARPSRPQFSDQMEPTPKEFLHQKQPKTDVERMACLAYYLTHYRNMPYFKTLDLAKLNTEAAQPKFSNAAYTVNNAQASGYLVPGPKGERQISAAGEQFVLALPDHEAARNAISIARKRKAARRRK